MSPTLNRAHFIYSEILRKPIEFRRNDLFCNNGLQSVEKMSLSLKKFRRNGIFRK